jgi:hypothetical protein
MASLTLRVATRKKDFEKALDFKQAKDRTATDLASVV